MPKFPSRSDRHVPLTGLPQRFGNTSGSWPVLDVVEHADQYGANADNPEKAEFFVAVQWLDAVPETQAFNEVGLFGNQNTVCRPAAPNWRHTIERLKAKFPGWQH